MRRSRATLMTAPKDEPKAGNFLRAIIERYFDDERAAIARAMAAGEDP